MANEHESQRKVSVAALAGMVGREVGVSRWFEITQPMVDTFADLTHDHYFIHVDPARAARETPFGGTIAHGFLSLSLLSAMNYDALPVVENRVLGLNYGFEKVRFVSPVKVGARIRGRFVLSGLDEVAPKTYHARYAVTVEIENEPRPALVAEWIGRFVVA